jgi:hypothetical protein
MAESKVVFPSQTTGRVNLRSCSNIISTTLHKTAGSKRQKRIKAIYFPHGEATF